MTLTASVFWVETALAGLNREHSVEHGFPLQLQDDCSCRNWHFLLRLLTTTNHVDHCPWNALYCLFSFFKDKALI